MPGRLRPRPRTARGAGRRRGRPVWPRALAWPWLPGLQAHRLPGTSRRVRSARDDPHHPTHGARRPERRSDQAGGVGRRPDHAPQDGHPEDPRRSHHHRGSPIGDPGRSLLMPQYHFRARDMEGRSHEGMQVAASEEEVLRTLDASQLVAISIRPQKPARVPKTRSAQPARQASDDVVQRLSALLEGWTSRVKTGEASGTLDKIMDQTATYLERAETLKMRVESALRYPIFVFSFAVLVLLVMLLKIVPLFAKIYSQFGVALPLPTRILLRISHIVTSNIVIVAGVGFVGAIVCGRILRSEAGRLWLDRVKLELPLFGPLIQMYAIGRVARTMG